MIFTYECDLDMVKVNHCVHSFIHLFIGILQGA